MLSFPLMALAAGLGALGSGDFREGAFPWLVAATAVSMVLYANGLRNFAGHTGSRVLYAASASLLVWFAGLTALFGGIALTTALGLTDPGGLIGMGPIAAGIIAIVGILLGFILLGFIVMRRRMFPWWARVVPILLGAGVPVGMVAMGATDDALEAVAMAIWMGFIGLGWAVLGYALWRTVPPQGSPLGLARDTGPHGLWPGHP